MNFLEHLNSCKRLSSVHLKRACEGAVFIYLKINSSLCLRGIKISFRVGKVSIIKRIWSVHHGLKFHLGLAKPCWNFNSKYQAEIFTCNCNVILQRSLLFSRDNFSTRYTEMKFQTGLKISLLSTPKVIFIIDCLYLLRYLAICVL